MTETTDLQQTQEEFKAEDSLDTAIKKFKEKFERSGGRLRPQNEEERIRINQTKWERYLSRSL